MGMFYSCEERIKLSKILVRLCVLKTRGYMKMEYDSEYLRKLYINDPDEFEKVTTAMIDDAINNMREENREIYRAKQWRLKQELDKIKEPLERMNRMVVIFWEGVNEFVEVTRNCANISAQPIEKLESGTILDFKKKHEN